MTPSTCKKETRKASRAATRQLPTMATSKKRSKTPFKTTSTKKPSTKTTSTDARKRDPYYKLRLRNSDDTVDISDNEYHRHERGRKRVSKKQPSRARSAELGYSDANVRREEETPSRATRVELGHEEELPSDDTDMLQEEEDEFHADFLDFLFDNCDSLAQLRNQPDLIVELVKAYAQDPETGFRLAAILPQSTKGKKEACLALC